ncbi:hypothetical protein NXG70_20680, partial [Klebsiella pneumoniae]|nr:hypothetical protein [Klebsiella pneumoniae]
SAQIREILISESAWEEMTCLFAPSLGNGIESRILFDQQRPDNIIEWSYARSDLKKQYKA